MPEVQQAAARRRRAVDEVARAVRRPGRIGSESADGVAGRRVREAAAEPRAGPAVVADPGGRGRVVVEVAGVEVVGDIVEVEGEREDVTDVEVAKRVEHGTLRPAPASPTVFSWYM